MDRRQKLDDWLRQIAEHVYFQPPGEQSMKYDCIVYERSGLGSDHADNAPYLHRDQYEVTAIYRDPDSQIPRKIVDLPACRHTRHFTYDNLHHDVFTITI